MRRGRQQQPQRQRILKPGMVRTASDILGTQAEASQPVIPEQQRVGSEYGHARAIFTAPNAQGYEVLQEVVDLGSASGFGYHPTSDRMLWVLSGALFVTSEQGGEPFHRQLLGGQFFRAPAGTKHGYSTDGASDAVVLLVQEANYSAGFKELTSPIGSGARTLVPEMAAAEVPASRLMSPPPSMAATRIQARGQSIVDSRRARNALLMERIDRGSIVSGPQAVMPNLAELNSPLATPPPQPVGGGALSNAEDF